MGEKMRRCRAPRCSSSIREDHFYCGPHFAELEGALLEAIGRVCPTNERLYIGRTNYPERRLLEHRNSDRACTHLAVLHWSGDPDEIFTLEERLITRHGSKLNATNRSRDSEGRLFGHWNCLYVTWSISGASRSRGTEMFVEVTDLDMGHRLLPRRACAFAPDLLLTKLSAAAAARAIDVYYGR